MKLTHFWTRNLVLGLTLLLMVTAGAIAQSTSTDAILESLNYRSIGPFRGGRSAAVAGVPDKPMHGYFGAAGGGVWKTEDGGSTWANISDGFFGGSIGALAVAPSDSNIIYVGGGEVTVRGNVSHGSGMWKSLDGGQTWEHIGLADSHHIPRIRIHPTNPDVVYVAALGHLYGPNQERGVYRTTDGGNSWERVLFVNDEVGACDLVIDPGNARVLYATTWRILRTPYSLESGGEGSGIFKSTDGGDSWTEITSNRGMPKGPIGISGITVSPVDSRRVWAIIEAPEGGVFRSDDAGQSWSRINEERKLRQRAWYYTRIFAGPQSIDEVYVVNVRFWRSNDGGRNFSSLGTPHGDHHDLWINPQDPDHLIIADDGGGQVSFDRGENWSTYMNQPTAQFYRVTTDEHFPYRIYGAQQDNSTVRILHRTNGGSIGERDWEPTAGGESGHIAPDPENPDIVYGGSYGGYLTRINHATGEVRNIHIWPDNPMGHGAGDGKFRFQWNFPIFFSHDRKTLFAAGNVLFKTENEGKNWEQISPDLTRNDPTKLGPSGGPITKDNTSVEYYCTIFAAAQSPHDEKVIWAGSDDGLLHVTRDGGKNWDDVTPPEMPEWAQINSIEVHPSKKGSLYVAATRYKLDDFKPYLFKTNDFGKTWTQITEGIDRKHFTRVLRADPDRAGLLYAGTENGMYISFNDGGNWQPFQLNLPIVPITDLAIKNRDLIVATQGRSFWVLDDLSLLHQWKPALAKQPLHLFEPRPVVRMSGRGGRGSRTAGQNASNDVVLNFHLKELPTAPLSVTLKDPQGRTAQVYSTKPADGQNRLSLQPGLNSIRWNMRYAGAKTFAGMILWGGGTQGPRAVPGTYQAIFESGDLKQTLEFEIQIDPRISATVEDLQEQHDFIVTLRDKLTEVHETIIAIRDARDQIQTLQSRIGDREEFSAIAEQAKQLVTDMTQIEEALYQTQNESPQDPLNFPIRLNNRLSALISVVDMGDNAPTQQSRDVFAMLDKEIEVHLNKFKQMAFSDIPRFNAEVKKANVPAVFLESKFGKDK